MAAKWGKSAHRLQETEAVKRSEVHAATVVNLIETYRKQGFRHPDELLKFVHAAFGIKVPSKPVCPDHSCPGDYLKASFFDESQDMICWANRGGGKTLTGAIATMLDSFFKNDCETKILGGSGEQSLRMYAHIKDLSGDQIVAEPLSGYIDGEVLTTRTSTTHGSTIQILTASSRSVRGPHPQRLKLDEIDEFELAIYQAALLIPISKKGIKAATHIYSTMHKPFGLMQTVVEGAAESGYKVYKWCIMDVLEKCVGRDCKTCDLWEDCQGRAQEADGDYSIEDAISAKRKTATDTWRAEMLCQIPSQEGLIYKEFDPTRHIKDFQHRGLSVSGDVPQ